MNGRKQLLLICGFALSLSFMASSLTALLVSRYYSRLPFNLLNSLCCHMVEQEPEVQKLIAAALKEHTRDAEIPEKTPDRGLLPALGYRASDFVMVSPGESLLLGAAGFSAGLLLFTLTFLYRNQKEALRIQALADYLEMAGIKKADLIRTSGEDAFSRLEDEISKTVTALQHTKDMAVDARNRFAENLSNIAHQLKTPITSISLSLQTMAQGRDNRQAAQIQRQLLRLTRLEEALLLLSRLDAGALVFQKEKVDVFTLLVLGADNLQELSARYETSIDIVQLGEMAVTADLEWTMEAVMNLMKNCMEHNRGGVIHCSYDQNPLYTQIRIWDEGKGFAKEELPHIFERFYRGKEAREGGIGIGLALAKEIIESQNGTLHAMNIPDAGACFEIRFYSH